MYLSFSVVLVTVSFCVKNNRFYAKNKFPIDSFLFLNIAIFFSIFISIVKTGSISPVRDLITISIISIVLFLVRGRAYLSLIRYYCLISAIICTVCTLTYLLYQIIPSLRAEWIVTGISISVDNPLFIRHESGDFEYSLLFYVGSLLLNADTGDIITPAFFTESTYLFAYMAAPLFFTLMDKSMKGRFFVFSSILISFMMAVSIYSIIVFSLALMTILFVSLNKYFSQKALKYMALTLILLLVFYEPFIPMVISLLPVEKASQFNYYFGERLTRSLDGGISFFGRPIDEFHPKSWGSSIVLFRYGVIGFTLYLALVVFYLLASLRFLFNGAVLRMHRICGFLMMFCTALMALKTPNVLLLTNLLFYFGWMNYVALYSDQGLVKL